MWVWVWVPTLWVGAQVGGCEYGCPMFVSESKVVDEMPSQMDAAHTLAVNVMNQNWYWMLDGWYRNANIEDEYTSRSHWHVWPP